jgi:hypothetical protein
MVAMETIRLKKKQTTPGAVIREVKIITKREPFSVGASTTLKKIKQKWGVSGIRASEPL